MATATTRPTDNEVTIRPDSDERRPSASQNLARYILGLIEASGTAVRMHELVVRNQTDALTPKPRRKRCTISGRPVTAILKSKARRIAAKPKKRTVS